MKDDQIVVSRKVVEKLLLLLTECQPKLEGVFEEEEMLMLNSYSAILREKLVEQPEGKKLLLGKNEFNRLIFVTQVLKNIVDIFRDL